MNLDLQAVYPTNNRGLETFIKYPKDGVTNPVYDNEDDDVRVASGALYTHSHNSWDLNVNVDSSDFLSLDISQLHRDRKPDGSLPDITFGKLRQGSDLINAGTPVGLPSNGAPDLGWHESHY